LESSELKERSYSNEDGETPEEKIIGAVKQLEAGKTELSKLRLVEKNGADSQLLVG